MLFCSSYSASWQGCRWSSPKRIAHIHRHGARNRSSRHPLPLFLLPFLLLLLFACQPFGALAETTSSPIQSITVVSDDNYPPYIFRDPQGALHGILVDQWGLWQKKTGIKVDLIGMDWGKAQSYLLERKADVIDTIFATRERKKLYDFTPPYATIEVPIFFHKNISGITDFSSLHGFTVGVKAGDACVEILKRHGVTSLQEYPSYESIVKAAAESKIRVFCADKPPAYYYLYKAGLEDEFRCSEPLYQGQFHRAVKKGDTALLKIVEKGFAQISASEYAAIDRKWLGSAIPGGTIYARYILYFFGAALVLALVLAVWILTLRRTVALKTSQINETLAALQQSEEKYRELVENAHSIIVKINRRAEVTFINEYGQEFFGFSPGEILGKHVVGTIVPEVESTERDLRQFIDDVLSRPEAHLHAINENVRRNGERVWINWMNRPVRNENGQLGEILCVGTDITERRRAEEALRVSNEILDSLYKVLPIGVCMTDEEGRYVMVNDAYCRIYGFEREELIGERFTVIMPPDGLESAERIYERLLRGDVAVPSEHRRQRKDGQIVHVETGNALLHLENGGRRVITVVNDITQRKQAEEERKRLEAQFLQVQKLESLGVLAGGIAHDFNNIIMAILGNTDLALSELSPAAPGRECLLEIEKASQRAADLCRQMLAYSGKGRFVSEPLSLSDVVTEMGHMLEVSVSKKTILRYACADAIPLIRADATQVRQIVMNLIINASEALGDKEGVVFISTTAVQCDRDYLSRIQLNTELPEGLYVCLEVRDTGHGMDRDTIAKIFDPFFSTKFTGRGLGLAAVLGIVQGHKGAFEVLSEPGVGTAFRVLFPADHTAALSEFGPETAKGNRWHGSGLVLLVDDEPPVLNVGEAMLKNIGFSVVTATNGVEAVEIFSRRAAEIVCVVLDLTMPRMDGEETLRELRRVRQDVPVLISSGYNLQEIAGRFTSAPLTSFIQKPYRLKELSQAIRESLV